VFVVVAITSTLPEAPPAVLSAAQTNLPSGVNATLATGAAVGMVVVTVLVAVSTTDTPLPTGTQANGAADAGAAHIVSDAIASVDAYRKTVEWGFTFVFILFPFRIDCLVRKRIRRHGHRDQSDLKRWRGSPDRAKRDYLVIFVDDET